jgi:predicted nucleic acid-binding protein
VPAYVFDASALTALFQNEPGGLRVRQLIDSAISGEDSIAMAVVNLGEVLYTLTAKRGALVRAAALRLVHEWPLQLVDATLEVAIQAAIFKAGQGMGYMDAFAAVVARRLRATLVTTDPDFSRVSNMINVEFLPQAPR